MKKVTMAAATVLLTLTGCNQLGMLLPGGGKDGADASNAVASQNQSASTGGKPIAGGNAGTQVADAGVTTSRSFQPGGGAAAGGKPGAGGGGTIDASLLIGSWTDNGDCNMAVDLQADGTFAAWNGGGGNWALNGDALVLSGPGGSHTLRLQAVDPDTLIVTNPDGSTGRSTRC